MNKKYSLPIVTNHIKFIQIEYPTSSSPLSSKPKCLTFHASWLWHNAPRNTLIPSGQRNIPPCSFSGPPTIHHCQAVNVNINPNNNVYVHTNNNDDEILETITHDSYLKRIPPPLGSAHPIHMSDTTTTTTPQGISVQQDTLSSIVPLLIIQWTHDTSKQELAYFDLRWLQYWAYDDHSLSRKRTSREVTPQHTFIHKFNQQQQRQQKQQLLESCLKQSQETEFKFDSNPCRLPQYKGLVHIDYNHVVNSSDYNSATNKDDITSNHTFHDGLFQLLHGLFTDGAVLITNSPLSPHDGPLTPVSIIGKMIAGSLSHGSLYGDIFHVQSKPNAHNVAYTSQFLCPHQDLAYYESKPGIQLLHCVENSQEKIQGGESILIDCMAAAYRLRELIADYDDDDDDDVNLFETLISCPATFVKYRVGADMSYSRPHIVLSPASSSSCTNNENDHHQRRNDNLDREIVQVNWAPPFEGPLSINTDKVDAYYKAYTVFQLMLDDSITYEQHENISKGYNLDPKLVERLAQYAKDYTWEYRLQEGDLLVFNNMRMLHGRRGFVMIQDKVSLEQHEFCHGENSKNVGGSGGRGRHLIGAYTNIDDTLNRYRLMLNEYCEYDRKVREGMIDHKDKQDITNNDDSNDDSSIEMKMIIPNVGNGTTSS